MQPRRNRAAEVAVIRPAQPRPAAQAVAGATERRLPGAMDVPIEQVVPDPEQPRRDWGHNDGVQRLEELADSIREFGILQPLLVTEAGTLNDGRQRYVIIAGARRRLAAEHAGLSSVPVLVRDRPSTQVRVLQLIENLQRQDLSPLDEARAYQELSDLENLSPPALAARLHVSAQHVRDRLRVLADQVLADAVERRQISASTARDIMKLPDEEVMAFRSRVHHGERLQLQDIAATRARLAADGIVNPRRRAPLDITASQRPPGAQPSPGAAAAPAIANGQQTVFVPGEPGRAPGPATASPDRTAAAPATSAAGGRAAAPAAPLGTAPPGRAGGAAGAAPSEAAAAWQEEVLQAADTLLGWLRQPVPPLAPASGQAVRTRLGTLLGALHEVMERLEG